MLGFGVDRISNGTIGDSTYFVDFLDRTLYVIQVIESIEHAHDTQALLYGLLIETVYYAVGIWCIAKELRPRDNAVR